ncbi:hypothetical protein VTJ04DRAFT_4504 [Mycothermus thermophilus]|uniref:uncharacterized protein n=1 Tax=Humicola insolens TaxID=85995 RepID=UPI003743C343
MPYVIHGTDDKGISHTLVVFTFHMTVRQLGKRFRAVHITIKFDEEEENHQPQGGPFKRHLISRSSKQRTKTLSAPTIVAMAPSGTSLYQQSEHVLSTEQEIELDLQFGLPGGGRVRPRYMYTRNNGGEAKKVGFVRVVGDPLIKWGGTYPTGVRWDLLENHTSKTGVPSFLRTAVLLKRSKGDPNKRFQCTVKVREEVSGVMSRAKDLWYRLTGSIPEDDPIVFDPSDEGRPGPYEEYRNRLTELRLDDIAVVATGDG